MKLASIDPGEIRLKAATSSGVRGKAAFSDVLGGISDMGPAAAELVGQWTGGSEFAGAVLNAAFSGIDAMSGGYNAAAYSPYSTYPGIMGSPRYGSAGGVYATASYGGMTSSIPGVGATGVEDPSQYTREIMTTMNQNNLKLLELQALMQSNMQSWTTKSNILSADHRSRMSMIEKFTARA